MSRQWSQISRSIARWICRSGRARSRPPAVLAAAGRCAVSTAALALALSVPVTAQTVDIPAELARLQGQHGFAVTGAEHLDGAVGWGGGAGGGDSPAARLRVLLERFDHIIVETGDGGVEKVIILGVTSTAPRPLVEVQPAAPSTPPAGGAIELPTIRSGNQHAVEVALEGVGGRRVQRSLLIDTGADSVVLPASMIAALGLVEASLRERDVHTANGTARARVGVLPAIWLGEQPVGNVEVAFLEDDKLGVPGLLGMNVLGRFQMTIDDATNRLTLTGR